MLVLGPDPDHDSVGDALRFYLDSAGVSECYVQLNGQDDIEAFVDEVTWHATRSKVMKAVDSYATLVVCVHYVPDSKASPKKSKRLRTAMALLVRLLTLAAELAKQRITFALMSAWPLGSEIDVRSFDEVSAHRLDMLCFELDDVLVPCTFQYY